MNQIIECVPNFSEGRDKKVIAQIVDAIDLTDGVSVLNVDSGKAANRTVVTFVGNPKAVVEAAYRGIKKAAELIDMSQQKGEHPRMGATDVCPLVPVANISMEETVKYADQLAERVGNELEIPVYCYEFNARIEERESLAYCRSGEYEALPKKIEKTEWKPDFGPVQFNEKAGATVIGARNFLVAYNINLNTKSVEIAKKIAAELRESGRLVKDASGKFIRIPGKIKKLRAIGWYIEDFGCAQVSMNLIDIKATPVYLAYEEVKMSAEKYGVKVTGSEQIGLIPLQAILETGKYFLQKQNKSTAVSDNEIINCAVHELGLNELAPFDPSRRIIEYLLK